MVQAPIQIPCHAHGGASRWNDKERAARSTHMDVRFRDAGVSFRNDSSGRGARIPSAMAIRRIRSDVDRTRRFLGAVFMAIATWLIVWIAIVVCQAGRIRVAGIVSLALLGGLLYFSLRLLRPKDVFDIDVERREYVVIRDGRRAGKGPLDDLG